MIESDRLVLRKARDADREGIVEVLTDPDPRDPIEDLKAGWDLAVEFGLANPALFTLMYSGPSRNTSAAFQAGMEILMGRIRRLAAGGWLRVDEDLAAMIIHATARGAVLTWLSWPEERRDPALLATSAVVTIGWILTFLGWRKDTAEQRG